MGSMASVMAQMSASGDPESAIKIRRIQLVASDVAECIAECRQRGQVKSGSQVLLSRMAGNPAISSRQTDNCLPVFIISRITIRLIQQLDYVRYFAIG